MQTCPPIDLAPIQGLTNDLYRNLYHQFFAGVDRFFAPFVKIQKHPNLLSNRRKFHFSKFDPAISLVPQILSNDAEEFLILDQALHAAGYPAFNWNLGCPMPMVTRKKRGSGLLPFPDQIKSILEQIVPKLCCRLSVKTRLGLNHSDELLTLIPIFNQFPIQELIIHPRLGKQLYKGQVDLHAFDECLRSSKHPVTYNGDVFSLNTFRSLQEQFPQINRWMLGRGILANPFLPEQIKGRAGAASDKLERLRQFHDEYAAQYGRILSGPSHLLDKLKEFWSYVRFLFTDGQSFYHRLLRIKHYEDYCELVSKLFFQAQEVSDHLDVVSEDFRSR